MKGKILGFSEAEGSGAISAEDGSRYRFTRADWRGDRPPAAGGAVDFESIDGAARDIYPVAGGAMAALGAINVDMSAGIGGDAGARVKSMVTGSLATPLAIVMLAATLLPALVLPMMEASVLGLNELTRTMGAAAALSGERTGGGEWFLILRFAPLLAAMWLLWTAWSGGNERLALFIGAGGAFVGAGVVFLLREATVSMAPEMAREAIAASVGYGLGFWLLLLVGGALVAAGLGVIRNPLGAKS